MVIQIRRHFMATLDSICSAWPTSTNIGDGALIKRLVDTGNRLGRRTGVPIEVCAECYLVDISTPLPINMASVRLTTPVLRRWHVSFGRRSHLAQANSCAARQR